MNELRVIEHKNQRVLTTAQLAEAYNTEENNIRKNYSNNQERFVEGVHFYLLKGDDLAAFKRVVNNFHEPLKYTSQLILWTHKGASRHCKMLDTDEAWAQFDVLEETYFKAKEMFTVPKTLPEALRYAAELAEINERQKPLVAFAETVAITKRSILIREMAKLCCKDGIEIGERRLYKKLREWKLIFPYKNEPYQKYIDCGYFEVNEGVHETSSGHDTHTTMRVLPKGQIYIINRLKEEAA